jgi:hypothetical protein
MNFGIGSGSVLAAKDGGNVDGLLKGMIVFEGTVV